jgi:hypothetical protein
MLLGDRNLRAIGNTEFRVYFWIFLTFMSKRIFKYLLKISAKLTPKENKLTSKNTMNTNYRAGLLRHFIAKKQEMQGLY